MEAVKAILPTKELFRTTRYVLDPTVADNILNEKEEDTIYTPEYREALEDEIKKYKKFVITTAVIGKAINQEFVNSIRNYAKRNNALLLVLPCEDVVSRGKRAAKTLEISPELNDFKVVFKDTYSS